MTEISELIKIKNLETTIENITNFIENEVFEIYQKKGVVIGLSGGIDSAITAALCTKSISSEKISGSINIISGIDNFLKIDFISF